MANIRIGVFYAIVFLAFYFGGVVAGPAFGVLIGSAAFVTGLAALDVVDGRFRAADEQSVGMFVRRHRGNLLGVAFSTALIIIATALFGPSFWASLAGVGGGIWLGEVLGERLGWSEATTHAEGEARIVALAIVCRALAETGDDVVTAEMQDISDRELRRVADLTLQPLGFESDADFSRAMRIVRDVIHNANGDLATMLASLSHAPQAVVLAETAVLRAIYAARPVPQARLLWLAGFYRLIGSAAAPGGLWAYYDRARAADDRRERWLAELGLADARASDDEVKRAYRACAANYHPDRTQDAPAPLRELSEAKMRAVNEAYEGLTSTGRASGPMTFRGQDGWPFTPPEGEAAVCTCWLCEKANRLPRHADRDTARCGECHALLGTYG